MNMISCGIKYILYQRFSLSFHLNSSGKGRNSHFLDMMFDCETRLSARRKFSVEKLGLHVKMIWVNLD